jgi:hypothetical protein
MMRGVTAFVLGLVLTWFFMSCQHAIAVHGLPF